MTTPLPVPYGSSNAADSSPLAAKRMLSALSLLGSAGLVGAGWVLWGGYEQLLGGIVSVGVQTLAFLLAAVGFASVVGAAWALPRTNRRRVPLIVAAGLLMVLGLGAALAAPIIVALLGGVFGVGAVIVAIGAGGERADLRALPARLRVGLSLPFVAVTVLIVVVGVLQILVWNPLAKVPGRGLDEIYAAMAAANESSSPVAALLWAGFWLAAAVTLAVLCALPRLVALLPSRRIVVLGLVLVGATASLHWTAGFGMGMALADTFATSGGDAAPAGAIIALVGQAALVSALRVGLVQRGRPVPSTAAALA